MDHIQELSSLYPKSDSFIPEYGTAGYRADAQLLESTVFRCGILMAIKSLVEGSPCGIMITASHNPINDNGVKLIDINGEMINEKWEKYADLLTKSENDQLIHNIMVIISENQPKYTSSSVFVGYDTRPSRYALTNACKAGIMAMGVEPIDIGQVTTPELQYYVYKKLIYNKKTDPYSINLIHCFSLLKQKKTTHLHVDCANGVGAHKLKLLAPLLEQNGLILHLHNTNGILNHLCGSDYVDKYLTFPNGMDDIAEGERCCSLDGDADRIIYFTKQNGKFKLLNGDKIAILFGLYLNELCKNINPSFGIIQTNYANGAYTSYIRKHLPKVKNIYAKTGVKYLHTEAKQFDIGIYFESNGHGTILFDENFLNLHNDNIKLRTISKLASQVTGDAIANMLLVEIILMSSFMSFDKWCYLYEDLPYKQMKFSKDRTLFKTDYCEQRCISPISIQNTIDKLIYEYPNSRCFVRPSGTENVVRLYVESQNIENVEFIANKLASEIENIK